MSQGRENHIILRNILWHLFLKSFHVISFPEFAPRPFYSAIVHKSFIKFSHHSGSILLQSLLSIFSFLLLFSLLNSLYFSESLNFRKFSSLFTTPQCPATVPMLVSFLSAILRCALIPWAWLIVFPRRKSCLIGLIARRLSSHRCTSRYGDGSSREGRLEVQSSFIDPWFNKPSQENFGSPTDNNSDIYSSWDDSYFMQN